MSNFNYSPNPSAESDLTNFTAINAVMTRVAIAAPGTGNYSVQLVANSSSVMGASQTITGLTVGNRYNVSFYYKVTSYNKPFVMQASTGVYPGIIQKFAVLPHWSRVWCAFTATATSSTITFQSTIVNTSGDTVLIDRIKVTDGEFMGPYFDGNYPYCSWTGTTNNSISTCPSFTGFITTGSSHAEDPVLANGLCLNNLAWNISTKSGRYSIPSVRGSDTTVPGQRGRTFVKNKPVDVGLWTLQMWVLGCLADGTIPSFGEMKHLFDYNYEQLVQNIMSVSSVVKLVSWQTDGSARTASGKISSSITPDVSMGGRRAELTIAYDILEGVWSDVLTSTVIGTAGTHWSNDVLVLTPLVGGSATIENAIITINGPITNPRITDATTNTWVQYNGTLSSSDTWVVDCGVWTSKLNGSGVLSSTQHYGHPRFLVIDPGALNRSPQVSVTGTATGSTTNISIVAARQHWSA